MLFFKPKHDSDGFCLVKVITSMLTAIALSSPPIKNIQGSSADSQMGLADICIISMPVYIPVKMAKGNPSHPSVFALSGLFINHKNAYKMLTMKKKFSTQAPHEVVDVGSNVIRIRQN